MRIYIDCGAHEGVILKKNLDKFDKFFIFEPNPELTENLNTIIKQNPSKDISFFPSAVWIKDAKTKFYLSKEYTTGSTLVKGKISSGVDYQNPINVNTIDFSKWISMIDKEFNYIFVKMDIEGAEYDVLEKMIDDKTIQLVDEFLIEFHTSKLKIDGIKKRHDKIMSYAKNNNINISVHQ